MCFGCCGKAKWKREIVVDHKFDYIDMDDYKTKSCLVKMKYAVLFLLTFRVIFAAITDILTVTFLYMYRGQGSEGSVLKHVGNNFVVSVAPYVYLGCLVMSVALFLYDCHKSYKIIKSREISFAFTNTIAYRYYALRWYKYFCFFDKINHMQKTKDQVALFVFFRLKGWKRILFAEAPRYAIVIAAIIGFFRNRADNTLGNITNTFMGNTTVFFMSAAAAMFAINLILMLIALIVYIPLVCEIRGNLKEYCCHKIDKRIAQLISQSSKHRGHMAQLRQINDLKSIHGDQTKNQLMKKTPPIGYNKRFSKYQVVVDSDGKKYAINYVKAPRKLSEPTEELEQNQRRISGASNVSTGAHSAHQQRIFPRTPPIIPPKVQETSDNSTSSLASSSSSSTLTSPKRRPRELAKSSPKNEINDAKEEIFVPMMPTSPEKDNNTNNNNSDDDDKKDMSGIIGQYHMQPSDMTDFYVDIPNEKDKNNNSDETE